MLNLSELEASPKSTAPHFLLVGNPVSHSCSPLMHNTAAEYYNRPERYYAVKVRQGELPALNRYLQNDHVKGANVTIPYKKALLDYMDELEPDCQKIGAVNTIVKKRNLLQGYNTDWYGFCAPLRPYVNQLQGKKAIIFGTGGASRAIVHGLNNMEMQELLLVSRHPRKSADDWPEQVRLIAYDKWPGFVSDTALIVNATPLGMEPRQQESPVRDDKTSLLGDAICYDIVYTPAQTRFLRQAQAVGARTIGGLEMLIRQGSRSFKLWTGQPFPLQRVRQKLRHHLRHAH